MRVESVSVYERMYGPENIADGRRLMGSDRRVKEQRETRNHTDVEHHQTQDRSGTLNSLNLDHWPTDNGDKLVEFLE